MTDNEYLEIVFDLQLAIRRARKNHKKVSLLQQTLQDTTTLKLAQETANANR